MHFHELEAFIILSQTLNFARASEKTHMSSSAFSRLIKRLEDELGIKLVIRDTKKVELTEEGEEFLVFAQETIHRKDDLHLRLGKKDDSLHGILRIYASVTACYSILPPFVHALNKEHPALRLNIETGDPAGARNAVLEERAELAIDALPSLKDKTLVYFSITKTPLVLIAQKNTSFAQQLLDCYKPEVLLSKVPLILPKSGLARKRFDEWVKKRDIKPSITAETAGNEAVFALSRLNLGVGLVPKIILENSPFAKDLIMYDAGAILGYYDIGFIMKPSQKKKSLYTALTTLIRRTYN